MQIYSKAQPFRADKRLFKKHFQSNRVSQNHLCRIPVKPTAHIVLIREAWTGLACLRRALINWLWTEFQILFQSRLAVKLGSRDADAVQLNHRRKCSPCCKNLWRNQTSPIRLIKPRWHRNVSFVARELSVSLYRPTQSWRQPLWIFHSDYRFRQFSFRVKLVIMR